MTKKPLTPPPKVTTLEEYSAINYFGVHGYSGGNVKEILLWFNVIDKISYEFICALDKKLFIKALEMKIVDAKKLDINLFLDFMIFYGKHNFEYEEILFRYETLRKYQYDEIQFKD